MTERSLERYLSFIPQPEELWQCITQPLPTCVWVNPLKTTPTTLANTLQQAGIELEPVAWYPGAFRSGTWQKPGNTIAFAAGWYYVQEEIALTAVQALDPQPGERVLDLCAAPGGKTAQIAMRLAGTGMVVANEMNIGRLASLKATIARLGLLNVSIINADGRTVPLLPHSFDRVLVDVPCSSEGTLRKRTNSSNQWNPGHSQRIASVQQQLLDRALQLVKPGGVVVYSTCTFAPEENEAVIDAVLGDRGYLESAEISGLRAMPGLLQWEGRSFRADLTQARRYFPHFNDTGGFFVARLRRTEAHLSSEQRSVAPQTFAQPLSDSAPLSWFSQRFGIHSDHLQGLQFWVKGKDKVWLAESACQPPEVLPQTIGIPVWRSGNSALKPTTAALQRLGKVITRNVIELESLDAVHCFLSGQPQSCLAEVEEGYVHVRFADFELGCGLYRSGTLRSQIPKTLWLHQ
jgi:NOL1/NOP2/sun family putative RNA methylase